MTARRSRHARRPGMTLLEVIIALTVAGAALATGAAVLGFLGDQQEKTGAQAIASANAVRSTVRDWITDAELTTQGDASFNGISSSRVLGDRDGTANDQLTFVTSAPTLLGASGTIIHLRMARGASDSVRGLVAELTPWRAAGKSTIVALDSAATGLRIRYLGSIHDTRGWQREWVTTSVLPSAIEVNVQYAGPRGSDVDRAAHALMAIPMSVVLPGRR